MTTVRVDPASISDGFLWLEKRATPEDGKLVSTRSMGRMRADGRFVPVQVLSAAVTYNAWLPGPPEVSYEITGYGGEALAYDYEPAEVECVGCGERYCHSRLATEVRTEADDEVVSRRVCPVCGHWECCEVEWEKPTQDELRGMYFKYRGKAK